MHDCLDKRTSSSIRRLVDTDEAMAQLEHVIATRQSLAQASKCTFKSNVPERDDDELRVLRAVFDVVSDDGNITEVESSVNLVHKV